MTGDKDWNGNWRCDGLVPMQAPENQSSWIILPGDDRHAIASCPCCDKPFLNPRTAMMVADAVYPL